MTRKYFLKSKSHFAHDFINKTPTWCPKLRVGQFTGRRSLISIKYVKLYWLQDRYKGRSS